MEIEEAKLEEQNDDEDIPGPATPDRGSDAETESDAEASDSGLKGGSSETLKSTSTVTRSTKEAASSGDGLPPQRSLPFGRAGTRSRVPAKKPTPPRPGNSDEDETDDEEL